MKKIKVLVAHDDVNVVKQIIDYIKNLDYVECVGSTITGKETCNKINELQPEMVFMKYRLSDFDGLEVMQDSKNKLASKMPIFNLIGNDITDDELMNALKVDNKKINTLITDIYEDRILRILKDYSEFNIKV